METATAPVTQPPAPSAPAGSIFAGDLDAPGFPRDLPSRIALLTALLMAADLLLPWVIVNGEGYAPTHFGLPTLVVLLPLLGVIAPPLLPRWRRAPITHMLPFGIGALMLGFAAALWAFSGPLAPALTNTLVAHVVGAGVPVQVETPSGASLTTTPLQVAPAIGLYLYLIGACALTGLGYLTLAAQSER
ncbi:MAG TPA: hypothetical protein VIC27_13470 [Ktedonobacterales bacterium]